MKKCPICKQQFSDPKHPNQKYCSVACSAKGRTKHDLSDRACLICGKIFTPCRPTQQYCSRACFGISIRGPVQTCEVCGNEFPYRANGVNRYCSYKCVHAARRKRIKKICPVCGKNFEVIPSRSHVHTCSWECGKKRRHQMLTCEQCGETVEVRAHAIKDGRRFCSYDCAAAWQKGENHSNWQGGHGAWRGPNWRKQSKAARKRDKNTCQRCGVTSKELDRPLDVHHIIPWRDFDNDWEKANVLSNLTSLCQRCHTSIEPRGCTRK